MVKLTYVIPNNLVIPMYRNEFVFRRQTFNGYNERKQ